MKFVIMQDGGQTAYHQLFATAEAACEAIKKSPTRTNWTVYELMAVCQVKRTTTVETVQVK
jgi:hypothetical protein